jgi:uracil-DNA glycosylase family 4
MNERQRRAWQALGIGPAWRLRESAETVGEPQGLHATAGAVVLEALPELPTLGIELKEGAQPETGPGSAQGAQPETGPGSAQGVPPNAGSPSVPSALEWPALRDAVASCQACGLCATRRNTVFGVGREDADWMFVGEAPGEQEDLRGEPFVGPAGQLLDAMLAALGRSRSRDVYIANVLKCRPPGNRTPLPAERAQCEPFLARQLELVDPKLIVALGKPAAQVLLGSDASVASMRGRVHRRRIGEREVPVIVTYHPAYLLRKPEDKAKAWADLVLALRTSRSI